MHFVVLEATVLVTAPQCQWHRYECEIRLWLHVSDTPLSSDLSGPQ